MSQWEPAEVARQAQGRSRRMVAKCKTMRRLKAIRIYTCVLSQVQRRGIDLQYWLNHFGDWGTELLLFSCPRLKETKEAATITTTSSMVVVMEYAPTARSLRKSPARSASTFSSSPFMLSF